VQELSLTVSLSAVELLYTLALFHSHEPEFSNIFPSLSNVQSYLKAKQHNTLKTSKITCYFQNMETQEKVALDSETDGGELSVVN